MGRHPVASSALGGLWGAGHCTGQLILGLVMVVLKERFDQWVPALDRWGGLTVGLTLLAIGGLGLKEAWGSDHETPAQGKGSCCAGAQTLGQAQAGPGQRGRGPGSLLGTYATGIVYGLQPDALFVVIPALTLPSRLAAASYMVAFLVGTVTAMGAYAGIIGATSRALSGSNEGFNRKLSAAASFVALGVGVSILVPNIHGLLC